MPTPTTSPQSSSCRLRQVNRVPGSDASEALRSVGYAVVPPVITEAQIELVLTELPALTAEASRLGQWQSDRKLHVENLLDAGPPFDAIWFSDVLLATAEEILGADFYILGTRYRAPLPGAGEQTLHVDDAGHDATRPRVLNVIVPLVRFTVRNGATRVLPRSHRTPPSDLPLDPLDPVDGQRVVECPAGSAVVFGAGLWHSGTRNHTLTPRHAIAISYAKRGAGISTVPTPAPETLARLGDAACLLLP